MSELTERRMLGDAPSVEALGRGPRGGDPPEQVDYEHPAAGWGAAKSVTKVPLRAREPLEGPRVLAKMNHEDGGFDCPGCAWPDHDLEAVGRLTEPMAYDAGSDTYVPISWPEAFARWAPPCAASTPRTRCRSTRRGG